MPVVVDGRGGVSRESREDSRKGEGGGEEVDMGG